MYNANYKLRVDSGPQTIRWER